jgi:hypothetical protein
LVLKGNSEKNEFVADRPIHITMASLDTSIESDEYVPVVAETNSSNETQKVIICTLSKKHNILQQTLDLDLNTGESVTFTLSNAKGIVNLSGFPLPDSPMDDGEFDEDEDGPLHQHAGGCCSDDDEDDEEEDSDDEDDDEDEDEDDEDDDDEEGEDDDEEEEEEKESCNFNLLS